MAIVRYVGEGNCANGTYCAALSEPHNLVIDSLPPGDNIAVRFENGIGAPIRTWFDGNVRDFLDLAIVVYMADELVYRGSQPDGWRRPLHFVMPVRNPTVWQGAEGRLVRTMSFLSGDDFTFAWSQCSRVPPYHVKRHRRTIPRGYDAVCLFSGGIDSLCGAYDLLRRGNRVLLVGHSAKPVDSSAQRELARWLKERFGDAVSLVQCWCARSRHQRANRFALPDAAEDTHRTRSLLFLALAAAVASAAHVDAIHMPENGLIALNSPLEISRMGPLSTRTAHPAFLVELLGVMHEVGAFSGTFRNPFLYQSKAQVVSGSPAELRSVLRRTVSCAHPGRVRARGKRHCGYCVPCLYRRDSLIAAGLDCPDEDYETDVFDDLPSLTSTRAADIRAMTRFAKRVVGASEAERRRMVIANGFFPPNVGRTIGPYETSDYAEWSGMLLAWAEGFLDRARSVSSRGTKQVLGLQG